MTVIKIPTQGQIQQRAYELYMKRGCEPGREIEDWLIAEKELTEPAVAQISWAGTDLAAEQELRAEEQVEQTTVSKSKDRPMPRRTSA
jgi:hypothetical protein